MNQPLLSVQNLSTFFHTEAGVARSVDGVSFDIGPGESRDVIFTAPDRPGTYLLYDRKYSFLSNGGGKGYGGMMTEIRVRDRTAVNAYTAQTVVNG